MTARPICASKPFGVVTKTIGLAPCGTCGHSECWLHYLRWEVAKGIELNKAHHRLVTPIKRADGCMVYPGPLEPILDRITALEARNAAMQARLDELGETVAAQRLVIRSLRRWGGNDR